jgi:hypothetical protein
MRETIRILNEPYQPTLTVLTRLDNVLSSAEAALARAEERLRQAQSAHKRGVVPRIFDVTVLERYPRFKN